MKHDFHGLTIEVVKLNLINEQSAFDLFPHHDSHELSKYKYNWWFGKLSRENKTGTDLKRARVEKSSQDADKLREIRGTEKPAPIAPWKTETITEMWKLWNSH